MYGVELDTAVCSVMINEGLSHQDSARRFVEASIVVT